MRDGFCSSDGGFKPGGLQNFRRGRAHEIMTVADFVAFTDDIVTLSVNRLLLVYARSVFLIGDDAAVLRIRAGGDGRAVDFRAAGINRVMILEHHSVLRELIQRGRMFLADEIRPHAVPHNDDDMFRLAGGKCG